MWRKDESAAVMCNSCYLNHLSMDNVKDETNSIASESESVQSGSNSGLRVAIVAAKQTDNISIASLKDQSNSNASNVRKSARIKPSKSKAQQKANPWKGKNRRYVFKKNVSISPSWSFDLRNPFFVFVPTSSCSNIFSLSEEAAAILMEY